MASVTLQLILYRLRELNCKIRTWFEMTSTKYQNLRLEAIDVLDLYVFGWIIATLFVLTLVKIVKKCIQLKILQLTCFWVHFVTDYLVYCIYNINFQEKVAVIKDILNIKLKFMSSWNDDVIKWVRANSALSEQLLTKFLQSLNKEAERILGETGLSINFQSIKMMTKCPQISRPSIKLEGDQTLAVHFAFELSDILVDLKACSPDWEQISKLHARHFSGEARLELGWTSSVVGLECLEVSLSVQHLTDFLIEHSAPPNVQMPYNIEDILCRVVVGSRIKIQLSESICCASDENVSDILPCSLGHSQLPSVGGQASCTLPLFHKDLCDSKLIVRIIKVDSLLLPSPGLGASIHIHCKAALDHPAQRHLTTSINNTSSPYFDETFLFSVGPSSKQLAIEVFCSYGGSQTSIGTCSRTLEELRLPPYRKFLPLKDSKWSPNLHINEACEGSESGSRSTLSIAPNNHHENNDNSISNSTTNIHNGNSSILSMLATPAKKSCGTLCAEFLFMEADLPQSTENSFPDFTFPSDLDLGGLLDTPPVHPHQSKSSMSISRDFFGALSKYSPRMKSHPKTTGSEIFIASNLSIQSSKTLTNDLEDATVERRGLHASTDACASKKRWSLLTTIRRRLGETGRSSGKKIRSKSAEPAHESTSKSIYNHYQCTPLRSHRHQRHQQLGHDGDPT